MFKQSSFYRTDIWVGRYLGNPLAAWTHLLVAVGMAAFLYLYPEVQLGWYGAMFLLVPGCWLFMTGTIFGIQLMTRFIRRDIYDVLSEGRSGVLWLFFNRGSASFFMMVILLSLSVSSTSAVTFDNDDFHQCVATLDPVAQKELAQTARVGMPRHEFWRACAAARQFNATRPSSLKELQAATRN